MRSSEVRRRVVCISSGRLGHEATTKTIRRFQARAMFSNLFLGRTEQRERKSNDK
jgi:hypothetical protein